MPRDLFGNVTRPSISVGTRKWYTVPVSLLSHAAIVLALIAIPILAPAAMPSVFADDDLILITKIMPPAPPLPPKPKVLAATPPDHPGISIVAPTGINPERPMPEGGWEASLAPGTVAGTFDGTFAPPPPPPVRAAPPAAVRVGTYGVRPPQKLNEVSPAYPPIAAAAHIQGIVIIEATISENGTVINARVLRSVPLLDQAAIEAVKQWRYNPSMLNGVPVPVIMTVTVNFTLR
jgi:protein TonB